MRKVENDDGERSMGFNIFAAWGALSAQIEDEDDAVTKPNSVGNADVSD